MTDLTSGEVSLYDYSRDNWARRPACMREGLVMCWAPSEVEYPHTKAVITSGRRWELVNDCDK